MKYRGIFLFAVTLVFCLSVSVRSQDEEKFTVSTTIPKTDAAKSKRKIVITINDSRLHLITVTGYPSFEQTSYMTSGQKVIAHEVEFGEGKDSGFIISAFLDGTKKGTPPEKYSFDKNGMPQYVTDLAKKPDDETNDGKTAGGGKGKGDATKGKDGEAPAKKIEIGTITDVPEPQYKLEIKPGFKLDEKRRYYRVTNTVLGRTRDSIEDEVRLAANSKDTPENPQLVQVDLFAGTNVITVEVLDANKEPLEGYEATTNITCDIGCGTIGRSINTRAIVGMEQVGASSAGSKTSPFLDLFVSVPLSRLKADGKRPPFISMWADFRLSSTAAQRFANLSNITTNVLGTNTPGNQINDVVQSFRVNAGLDIRLVEEKDQHPFFLPGRSSLSLIFGGGITSPLTGGGRANAEIYKIPKNPDGTIIEAFRNDFPFITDDKQNIAFVVPERDRFLRRWFVGGRLKTFFYKNKSDYLDMSPATFDVTIGQDEAITRTLQHKVLSFEGFTPLPIRRLEYLYLFGGATMRLTRKVRTSVPNYFLQAGEITQLGDPLRTVIVSTENNPLTVSNRDTYFFGIGVDLFKLFANKTPENK